MDLLRLPRDVLVHLILDYLDPLACIRLACVSRAARRLYVAQGLYERLYRRAYPVAPPRGGKGWRKRRDRLAAREQDPVRFHVVSFSHDMHFAHDIRFIGACGSVPS